MAPGRGDGYALFPMNTSFTLERLAGNGPATGGLPRCLFVEGGFNAAQCPRVQFAPEVLVLAAIDSSEDVALVQAPRNSGAGIAWSAAPRVLSCARRVLRVPAGFAA